MKSGVKKIIEVASFVGLTFIVTLIVTLIDFRSCVSDLIFKVISPKLMVHPFFWGVIISWLVAVISTFIVLSFAYCNRGKKEQYKEIFRQSEKGLRVLTVVVLFYIAIHLASKAFCTVDTIPVGIPIFGESYVAYDISPQDVFLSFFVFFIIISLFLIAPYVIDKYKNIIRILLSISFVLSILIALCIPSFVPVIAPTTEPPQMPGSYLFSLNAGLEDNLSKGVISEELNNSFKTTGFSLSDNATVKKEKENEWVITDKEKFIVRKEDDVYLFSWDNVSRNDNETLIRFLRDDLDMGWVENAEINKSDDGKTFFITKDENSAEIKIDEKEGKAPLKIGNYDLKVKKENGKLNIYEAGKLNVYRGERDLPVLWFFIIFVFFSIVSLLIYKFMEIPKGIKSDFRDLLLVFCFMPAIIVASLLLAGDELVKFPNVFGNIVVGLVLISGFATLMSMVTISFKPETVSSPWRNPVWLCSTFASLAFISLFSMVFLLLRDFLKIDIDIFGKALNFSVAIMIVILLYGFLYEKLQKYHFTEWWRRECRPIAMIISILLIAIVSVVDPKILKLLLIFVVLIILYCLPWIIMGFRRLLKGQIPKLRIKLPMHQGMVLVKAKTDPGSFKEVVKELDGMEGVYQTMVVRGEYDVCLTVEGVSSEDIEKKILEIRKIDGVADTTTLTDIREFFDREVR